jgi:uroporphyrinogen-III decarboxylase
MDFKERIMTTMNHEEPDRVPVMGLIMDPATVNQVLGKESPDLIAMMKDPARARGIVEFMKSEGFWERTYYSNSAGALESAVKLGFDANWTIYAFMQPSSDPESAPGMAWNDVFGRLWQLGSDQSGNMTFNYCRGLCQTEEQWEAWVEEKAPLFEVVIQGATDFHKTLADEFGDRILPVGLAGPGLFENSWQPIGFVEFTRFIYEKPEFVRRVVDFYTDFYLRYLEGVMRSGVEVVMAGDDLGQKTGPMLRPELVEQFYGESYRRIADAVHRQNKKLVFHSCGNVYKLLQHFIEWGFDGVITLEPTAGMDLGEVREQVGHELVLIGNLDVSYLLVRGSQLEIEDAVKKAIRDAAKGGGFILSPSHSHALVDPTRLKWLVDAAHRYGTYPIRI